MYHQTKGIVISNTKYAETSIVCKVYTENFGLQTYIINGVRKKKGKSIYYQPLSLLDLTVYHKEKSTLQRVKEGTYGFCEETGEPIGLKRLMARPVATLSIEAQEKHERDEKIFIDD